MKKTLLAAILALAMPFTAQAASITISGSSGNLAASVTFDHNEATNVLTVTLTNTSLSDVLVPADVLTAVLFELTGGATLDPVSALLGAGSTVLFDSQGQPAGGNVGGEWEYNTSGISSAGFGLFGDGNFNGPDLDPPDGVNGLNYGITSAGDNPLTGNSAVTGGGNEQPLIKNSVVFTLNVDETNGEFFLNNITGVSFQYGTNLTEPNFTTNDITLPDGGMTLSLLGLALGGLGLVARRRA